MILVIITMLFDIIRIKQPILLFMGANKGIVDEDDVD